MLDGGSRLFMMQVEEFRIVVTCKSFHHHGWRFYFHGLCVMVEMMAILCKLVLNGCCWSGNGLYGCHEFFVIVFGSWRIEIWWWRWSWLFAAMEGMDVFQVESQMVFLWFVSCYVTFLSLRWCAYGDKKSWHFLASFLGYRKWCICIQ